MNADDDISGIPMCPSNTSNTSLESVILRPKHQLSSFFEFDFPNNNTNSIT